MGVFRCFSEKREGFDVEAQALARDLRDFLGIHGVESVRIINRYDVEGITESVYKTARENVFSEPQVDDCYDEIPPELGDGAKTLIIEMLPGQYDQRADSCAQCIQMVSRGDLPTVKAAKLYVLYGNLTSEDMAKVREYLINPVESREAAAEKPDTLITEYPEPEPVKTLHGLTGAGESELRGYLQEFGLAMDLIDLRFLQEYFAKTEKRDPTETELRMIDTYWSDHCRHTTFNTNITKVSIDDPDVNAAYKAYLDARREVYGNSADDRPQTLMDIATIAAKALRKRGLLSNIDISEEVNACSIHVDVDVDGKTEDWLLMFKNETHNHPTEIEPFGGAATCVGGAIRDPLSGRAYVYQAMRITGAGDPRAAIEDTIPGKIPQRKLTQTAARGYSSYGNQIGVATGLVHEIYHPGYVAKRMELGAVVGAVRAENVVRETPAPGDKVILLGGRTGRDGVGGAAGSSKAHTDESVVESSAEVQKGNAPEERKIQRLFLDPDVTKMIKRCNDFGAGGVSVAVGELADGLDINLSLVCKKYAGLSGTEIAISESQERMAVVIAPRDVDAFIEKAAGENLEAYVIAEVTEKKRLVMRHEGKVIVDISREFLSTNGAEKYTQVKVPTPEAYHGITLNDTSEPLDAAKELKNIVSDIRFSSQRGLYEMFDGTVGAASVLTKNGGKIQSTPVQSMAALLPVMEGETSTCSVMSFGFDPYSSEYSPYIGARTAVITSVAKLVAAGCDPSRAYLTFQEYFERLRDEPTRWGKPFAALLGAFEAQMELGLAAIGGKDSMSGSFNEMDVPPTLVSFAIAPNEAENVISPEFKEAGRDVVLFNSSGNPKNMWLKIRRLIEDKTIVSAWAVTSGGAVEGIFKMTLGNEIGFECTTENPETLFADNPGAIVAEITKPVLEAVTVGRTIAEPVIKFSDETLSIAELRAEWEAVLEPIFPTKTEETSSIPQVNFDKRSIVIANEKFARPRALIFAFPGTNSEIDTARAVRRAGGEAEIFVVRNLTKEMLEESITLAAAEIAKSQILIIPGGFSGGDEPDGSAKFITAFFRNPGIADVVHEHLKTKGGLMLGICNGFQALIKLGLVPFGEIVPPALGNPTLAFNVIGRHQAGYVYTRVASANSPWMSLSAVGDVHAVPISHGEGRFTASAEMMKNLMDKGQIATQYTDINGMPSMNTAINPNGSDMAVEGLFSPDGRVFGKMGHTERRGEFVAKNIYGNKQQPVFESGVNYFK
ncbi:MAG: phosphoribosylformylglycinamidine synthase [Oscillospiraceae bacterium]|nr:phosphoribosylformylglycinamidine synthase [Oscillospiraceae bacterium]